MIRLALIMVLALSWGCAEEKTVNVECPKCEASQCLNDFDTYTLEWPDGIWRKSIVRDCGAYLEICWVNDPNFCFELED